MFNTLQASDKWGAGTSVEVFVSKTLISFEMEAEPLQVIV